jgi:hypothetical protein
MGRFFLGLIMIIMGLYLFLNNLHVSQSFSLATPMMNMGSFHLTTGYVLIPFLFGIGMIFYNPNNDLGWFLVIISLILLGVGIISSVQFRLGRMTVFELMMIAGLVLGGVGLFLSGVRRLNRRRL